MFLEFRWQNKGVRKIGNYLQIPGQVKNGRKSNFIEIKSWEVDFLSDFQKYVFYHNFFREKVRNISVRSRNFKLFVNEK